ncbi:hypothetical protein ERJ75_001076900 [Trypanosoma vivax]|nr:hypothetical protein ERJ75_001076900 [Trypanosoma vivax]
MRLDARPWQTGPRATRRGRALFGGPPAETGACGAARRKERADEQTQSQRQVARPSERPARVTATPLSRRETAARAPAGSEERRSERGKDASAGAGATRQSPMRGESSRTLRSGERRQGREAQGRAMGRRARRALGARPPVDAASRRRSGRSVRGTERRPVATFPPPAGRAVPGGPGLWSVGCRRRMPCRAAVDALTATSVRQPGFASQTARAATGGEMCARTQQGAEMRSGPTSERVFRL